MTKKVWQAHRDEVKARMAWSEHDQRSCPECKARLKTVRANRNRRGKDQIMRDCGLVKVIGPVSGKVYWE